jgi:hypothetical protein
MNLQQVRHFNVGECLHRMANSVGWRGSTSPPSKFPCVESLAYLLMRPGCAEFRRIQRHRREVNAITDIPTIDWVEGQGWVHRILGSEWGDATATLPVEWGLTKVERMQLTVMWMDGPVSSCNRVDLGFEVETD